MILKKTEMMREAGEKNQTNQKKEVSSNKYGKRIQCGSGAAPAAVPPPAGRWRPWPGSRGLGPRRPSGRGQHAGLHGYGFLSFPLENVSAASPERCCHRNRKRLLLLSSSGLDITLKRRCKQVGNRAVCNRRRDSY